LLWGAGLEQNSRVATDSAPTRIAINRAPVLTLWAAVVAERLGYDRDEALTLGRAVAGLNAQAKGQRLKIFSPAPADTVAKRKRERAAAGAGTVELLGRAVPVVRTRDGLRAAAGAKPDNPESVERYLAGKFGESLKAARAAMAALARAHAPTVLAARAFSLYEEFRPVVPSGQRGWGAKGELDLGRVREMAARAKQAK
jgi:hypothetical protein